MDMVANLSSRQKAIVGLTLLTGVIHLVLGIQFSDALFILNFLGYFALVIALYFLPQLAGQRSLIQWGLIGYTLLTVILYFVMSSNPLSSVPGLITKAIEIILIILLFLDR